MAVPKLRFKEFDNDWINTKVKDLGEFSSGGTPSKDIHDYWNGNIPWISSSDLNEESISDIRINRFISEDAIKNSATKKIPKNSILLVSRVGVGKVALTNQELCTSQDFTALTPKKDYALFIAYLMKNITPRLLDLNQGTSIKGFVREDLISLPISLPSKAEQTKIASFLSAVDEKISQLTQKHELLSQYKQGMMQKLFSQQLRFKADDGSEFGEWEERLLSEIGSFKNGLNKDKESFGFGFPFVNLMDVFGKNIIQIDNLGLVDANQKDLENYDLKKGDVLFIRSSVKAEGVGQTALVLNDLDNTVYSGFLIRFRDTYGLDLGFKKYCFMNNEFRLKLLAKSTTSANTNINQESLSALSIKVPCLEEQFKIANFLSAIDQKIEVVAQQIEQAKTWKKGLLQQMFV
ncbi:MAG: restriction endonuclease subunit S [Acinetobacter towneri]